MTLNEVRSISGKDVLVYSRAASAGGILFMFGPEELGGSGDLAEKIKKIEPQDAKEKAKEADKVVNSMRHLDLSELTHCSYIAGAMVILLIWQVGLRCMTMNMYLRRYV